MAFNFVTDGNYVNFFDGENLVRRLHNTSRAIMWMYDDTTPDRLSFSVDGLSYNNIDKGDVEFDGTALTTLAAFETNIESYFPGYAGGGSLGYLVYTALLTQSGTDAPVATVLANTLGGTVVWARDSAGFYTGTLNEVFTENKTVIVPFGNGGAGNFMIGIGASLPFDNGYSFAIVSNSVINWSVYETATFNNVEFSSIVTEGSKVFIEIRVYP